MRVSDETRMMRLARQRHARRGRKLWLVLFAVVLLGVVGVLANLGPLTHLQTANARLQTASATVKGLETQKKALQNELSRLSESSYLETLAREQLTYARPGEDLYIVTGTSGDVGTPGVDGQAASAEGGPTLGASISNGLDPASASGSADQATGGQSSAQTGAGAADPAAQESGPGIFERAITAIRGLF